MPRQPYARDYVCRTPARQGTDSHFVVPVVGDACRERVASAGGINDFQLFPSGGYKSSPIGSVRLVGPSDTYSTKFTPALYPIGSRLQNLPNWAA